MQDIQPLESDWDALRQVQREQMATTGNPTQLARNAQFVLEAPRLFTVAVRVARDENKRVATIMAGLSVQIANYRHDTANFLGMKKVLDEGTR